MFECRYCGNVFEELTNVGACPACGGPKPKQLQPEVRTMMVDRYVYVPATTRSPEYFTPPEPTFRQRLYLSLGYKVAGGLTAVVVTALVAVFAYFWFFYDLGAPKDSGSAYQNIIPTAVFTVTPYHSQDPWRNTVWLTSEEALALRTQEQVIHLALLDRGGARYTNSSVIFVPGLWQPTKPLGVTEITVSGTSFEITINGFTYSLNVFQPFVIDDQPETIYLVDPNGQIWKTDLENATLYDLEAAQGGLPILISPNPGLSPTY